MPRFTLPLFIPKLTLEQAAMLDALDKLTEDDLERGALSDPDNRPLDSASLGLMTLASPGSFDFDAPPEDAPAAGAPSDKVPAAHV